ncbi:caspase domain-containing protein [Mycena leptocephala]|nr:caspase domain-containing protein [Mycena leptocephala]
MGHASTENDIRAIFALIIGIDNYIKTDELRTLRGAVNDARAFERYLLDLHVPPSNIVLLENENATRAAILSAFKTHFLDNTNIPDRGGSSMILYFAGHGSRFEAPSDLDAPERRVEAICPVDERTVNDAGEYVHAIPDYVLVRLLSELADKKGTNITVILDCCHAGGMERDVEGTRDARTAQSDSCSIPLDLDSHFWKGKNDTVQSYRMWTESSSSHVLLAACRAGETAREVQYPDGTYHGRFTTHLVPLLQRTPLESATCAELLNLIPKKWPGQTPYCGGARSNRLIFNGNYPATGRRSVLLRPQKSSRFKGTNSSQVFRVAMGTVEGVVAAGTELSAYDRNNNFLCAFIAQSVEIGETVLVRKENQPPIEIPPWSRAVVSDWKGSPMLVYTPADFPYTSVLFPTTGTVRAPNFVPAPSVEEAYIVVRSDGDEIVIEPRTSTALAGQPKPRFALGDPAHLPYVIDGVVHFSYFLGCANEADRLDGVTLEMHRLLGRADVEPPLPSEGTVTIGMGSECAFEFTLSPGELSSCGFLKLFVTSEYIDLRWIQQKLSPFDPRFVGTGRLRMLHEPLDLRTTRSDAMWDVLTVLDNGHYSPQRTSERGAEPAFCPTSSPPRATLSRLNPSQRAHVALSGGATSPVKDEVLGVLVATLATTRAALAGRHLLSDAELGFVVLKVNDVLGTCYDDPEEHPTSGAKDDNPLLQRAHLAIKAIPNAVYAHEMTQARFAVGSSEPKPLLRVLQLPDLQIRANAIETLIAASAMGTHASVLAEHAPALVRTRLGYTKASSALTSTRIGITSLHCLGALLGRATYAVLRPCKAEVLGELGILGTTRSAV